MGSNHRVSAPAVPSAWNAFSKEFQMAGLSIHVGVQMSLLEALLVPHLRVTFTHPSTLSIKLTHSISHLLFTSSLMAVLVAHFADEQAKDCEVI